MTDIDVYGQLADLKKIDYRNTLAIASVIEVLVEKGIIDKGDIAAKAKLLEVETLDDISKQMRKRRAKGAHPLP